MSPLREARVQPLARLRLRRVAVRPPRERAPVFHVFEELYERARQGQGGDAPLGNGVSP